MVRATDKIKEAVDIIKKRYQPEKIILFGSYAYGQPNEDSDIDLFIIKDTNVSRRDRFCQVRRMIRDIKGISIQPVIWTSGELQERLAIEDDFIKEVLAKGKVLYEG